MDKNSKKKKKNTELNSAKGTITEALPNTLFRVKLDDREEIIMAYLAGKMRMHRIKVLIGDRVEMILDPYGGRTRITKRL